MFIEHRIKECIGELRSFFSGMLGIETILEFTLCKWDVEKYIT